MSGLDLSDAYDNQRYVPDALERLGERAQRSLAFRARLQQVGRARLDLPYGDHLRQRYDLFLPTQASPKGLLVYIHGGYWHLRDKSDWSELASGALELGKKRVRMSKASAYVSSVAFVVSFVKHYRNSLCNMRATLNAR